MKAIIINGQEFEIIGVNEQLANIKYNKAVYNAKKPRGKKIFNIFHKHSDTILVCGGSSSDTYKAHVLDCVFS